MAIIHLCSGILRRGDRVLLTRSTYEGEPEALWTLPGGRQESGEAKTDTVVREFWEEASLRVKTGPLAYASESVDSMRGFHVLNCTFVMEERDERAEPRSRDSKVVGVAFVPIAEAPALLRADVLRIPVGEALSGDPRHYFFFREQDVALPFFRGAPRVRDI